MSRITSQEAIAIIKERVEDLQQYKDAEPEKISDYIVREKLRFRKSLYELNRHLLDILTGRDGLH